MHYTYWDRRNWHSRRSARSSRQFSSCAALTLSISDSVCAIQTIHSLEMHYTYCDRRKWHLRTTTFVSDFSLLHLQFLYSGKEKFFLGMSRRVGCAVWACPEKDRVLQAVEGRSFGHAPPHSCQLHVVPMRDLTHEVLYRSYYTTVHPILHNNTSHTPQLYSHYNTT